MKYFLLLLIILGLPSKAASLPDYCPQTMTVVFYGNWFPYMFFKDGQYKGIDYEFMKQVLDKINCRIVVNALPEKRAYQRLAKGDSLAMSGATITAQRQKIAYFSKPYRDEVISLFYKPLADDAENNLEHIIQNSPAIVINSAAYYGPTIDRYRHSRYASHFIHVPSLEKRIEMLERNRADAIIEDHIAGCYYLDKSDISVVRHLRSIDVSRGRVAFMFSKGVVSPSFIAIFNRAMQQLLDQGAFDDIVAKYLPEHC